LNNESRNKLLIVDDNPDIITTFKLALENKGYVIDSFTDPLKVISNFKNDTYDFVLLDIVMPDMDGFELYEELKKIDPAVRVCFMTAYDVNYESLNAIFESPDVEGAYFKKPVEINELIKYIDNELKKVKSQN